MMMVMIINHGVVAELWFLNTEFITHLRLAAG